MNTTLSSNEINPTNTTYGVPNFAINIPPIAAPNMVPKLADVKNKPLAKIGASGAEDIIQY